MDAKLKDILTKLNIENTHLTYFETGKFTDLTFNKEKRIYNSFFIIYLNYLGFDLYRFVLSSVCAGEF